MAITKYRVIQDAPKSGALGKRLIKRAVKSECPSEEYDQIRLAVWLDQNQIPFYAIPNGGKRNYFEAVKFKRCGVKAGVPDICITLGSEEGHHGLYIELKRESGGKVSASQKKWQKILRENGYICEVAYGFEEAKRIVIDYMSLKSKDYGLNLANKICQW